MNKSILAGMIMLSTGLLESKLIVVRHGQAEHNVQERFNSNPSHPDYFIANLTDAGKERVAQTAKELKAQGITKKNIAAVYVSPLPRTIQTAEVLIQHGIISPDQVQLEPRLIEVQMGNYEGKLHAQFPWEAWDISHAQEYGGETVESVYKRAQELCQEVSELGSDKYILFVTHGTPSRHIIALCTGADEKIPPGSFRIITKNS